MVLGIFKCTNGACGNTYHFTLDGSRHGGIKVHSSRHDLAGPLARVGLGEGAFAQSLLFKSIVKELLLQVVLSLRLPVYTDAGRF